MPHRGIEWIASKVTGQVKDASTPGGATRRLHPSRIADGAAGVKRPARIARA
jgi:hypothetical protein